MKILVVDRNPESINTLEQTLTENEYEIVLASTIEKAISSLEADSAINLIILDVTLKGLNGHRLLRFLRDNLRFKHIPVLSSGAKADKDVILNAIKLGARDFIAKPIDPKVLLSKVKSILDAGRGLILIVDDEDIILTVISKSLEREGFKTLKAKSGKEALKFLEEKKVNLVISDIIMPEMNGMELLANIKVNYPDIPVLMITGYTGKYNSDKVIAEGADGYIMKPFKNLEIVKQVKSLL